MAKGSTTAKAQDTIRAKFQATSVGSDPERVHLITVDAPDASGNNANTVQGGVQLVITDETSLGFFQAGGEYYFDISKVA